LSSKACSIVPSLRGWRLRPGLTNVWKTSLTCLPCPEHRGMASQGEERCSESAALPAEQLALILKLSLVDLAPGEALVEYLECGGATVTTEIKALTIKRIAAGRPAH
jgi:hypothetical protein